jgi:hypothetical protein
VVNKGVAAGSPAGHCLCCCCYANLIGEDALSRCRKDVKGVCRLSRFAEWQPKVRKLQIVHPTILLQPCCRLDQRTRLVQALGRQVRERTSGAGWSLVGFGFEGMPYRARACASVGHVSTRGIRDNSSEAREARKGWTASRSTAEGVENPVAATGASGDFRVAASDPSAS